MTDIELRSTSGNGHGLVALQDTLDAADRAFEFSKIIANTQFVPAGLRGKPDAILAAVMYGAELGFGPMQALAKIAVIDGRPSLYAEAQRGLILAAGHRIWTVEWTNTRCVLAGQRRDDDRTAEVTWTLDDAKRAKLDRKDNWTKYPRQMLLARATADLGRLLFADVLGGFPAAEEVGEEASSLPPVEAGEGQEKPTRTRQRKPAVVEPVAAIDDATLADLLGGPTGTAPSEEENLAALLGELEEVDAVEVDNDTLEPLLQASLAEVEPISPGQRRKMQAMFRERGVDGREPRLAYCTTVAKRPVESSNDLTFAEAGLVIEALEQWDPNDPNSKPFPTTDDFPEGY